MLNDISYTDTMKLTKRKNLIIKNASKIVDISYCIHVIQIYIENDNC